MTSQRDGFLSPAREILAKRAGQRCSNPDCGAITSGPHEDAQKAISLGVAAHITAAAPGGPRYNPNISSEDRSAVTNGIWLCQYCAKLVDSDIARFSEECLIIWKRRHEESVKRQMGATGKANVSTLAPGLLDVSAVNPHWPADGRSCVLDFRVSNQGGSDLMINAIEFQVLESLRRMPLGHAQLSALYDLDISVLEEFSSRAECQVAQILKPGEADRFGIVLSAPTLGMFAGWRFATLFKTNCGPFQGPEVEVWLPRPEILRPFATVTETISSQAESHIIEAGAPGPFPTGVAMSQPGRTAGFKTSIVLGFAIMSYCGPRPLAKTD